MYDPKACEHEAKEEKNVYCQRNSELRRLAGAMHCQIWVTRSVYMQFEAEDYRKIGFALYDYITLGYSQCSIDIINKKAKKLGSVAGPVILANGSLTFEDDLRSGGLLSFITQ